MLITLLLCSRIGYVDVEAIDKTDAFIDVLKREMVKFKGMREDFITEFSPKDYADLMDGWKIKVVRCNDGEQGWGLFRARKPM